MALKLITEPRDFSRDDYEYILEEKDRNSPSTLYIKGPFIGANTVNRNKRVYPLEEMVREVERYNTEMIGKGRSMGELNHPESADVNLERACHLITELKQDGNEFTGKSKVLSTPCGIIVRSLINDGVTIGVSTRALGQLIEEGSVNRVKNVRLITVDCVSDPSNATSFVNGILESKQWVLEKDGKLEELYDQFEKSLETLPRNDVDSYLREQFIRFINSIK